MKKKVRTKKVLILILGIAVIVAGGLVTTNLIKRQIKQNKNEAMAKENEENADKLNKIYLNMGDQKVLVGNTIQVEAYVIPQTELASSVEFDSSDNEVFTVTQTGVINVKSQGKATLTAKTGSIATSIIIEGVENEQEVESNEAAVKLPQEYAHVDGTSVLKKNTTTTSSDIPTSNEPDNTVTEIDGQEVETTLASSGENNVTEPTKEEDLPDLPVEDLENVRNNIENYGFTKCQDSSYAIYNDEEYYGQVIVDAKAIYIGIKANSSMTDEAFLNVLKIVLPDNYENCFSIYKSASNDRVMTMDNHKVNIMTGGDHTFINIYALDEE